METTEHSLSPGEKRSLIIWAKEKNSSNQLVVEPGQTYQFTVSPKDRWFDMGWPTNANGFNNVVFQWSGHKPRVEWAKCFALCAVLNENDATAFVVGTETRTTFPESGIVSFFANDVKGYYGNNWGKITVEVLRLT